jgi:hypothetical protein
VLAALLAVVVAWLLLVGLHSGGMTAAQAEALAASVPDGSTREEVEAILNDRWLGHSYISRSDPNDLSWMASSSGLDEQQVGGAIMVRVPHANLDPVLPGEINLYFFFDRDGRLSKRVVNPLVHNF